MESINTVVVSAKRYVRDRQVPLYSEFLLDIQEAEIVVADSKTAILQVQNAWSIA